MKIRKKGPKRRGWIIAWIIQIIEMLAVCTLSALSLELHPWLYSATLWGLVPILGACTACRAVRRGLLNYAAWIAPPVCLFATHTLIWGYVPSAGAMLLTALISLIGAAAGEVLNQQKHH